MCFQLLAHVQIELVPLATDAFGFFDVWYREHRAELAANFRWLWQLENAVGHIVQELLARVVVSYVVMSARRLCKVIQNALACRVRRQVAQNDAYPLGLAKAARVVGHPEANRLLGFIQKA